MEINFIIKVRMVAQDDYGVVTKDGVPLEFDTFAKAHSWFKSEMDGKFPYVASWFVCPADEIDDNEN